jgi:uncharacterized membrane protein
LFYQYGELIAAPIGDKTHSNGAVIIHNAKSDSEADKISPCTYATITFMLRENAEEARIALNGTLLGMIIIIIITIITIITIIIIIIIIRYQDNTCRMEQKKAIYENSTANC